jgi:hypothetical protein
LIAGYQQVGVTGHCRCEYTGIVRIADLEGEHGGRLRDYRLVAEELLDHVNLSRRRLEPLGKYAPEFDEVDLAGKNIVLGE